MGINPQTTNTASTITQHRPAYFTGFENAVVPFETADDLVAIPFVANFSTLPAFHQFSLWRADDPRGKDGPVTIRLMAEYDEGRRWWVVGRIDGASPDLPTWIPNPESPLLTGITDD